MVTVWVGKSPVYELENGGYILKISVQGRDASMTIFKNKDRDRVFIVLSGGTWLSSNADLLGLAATEIMQSVLAPLGPPGAELRIFARTPSGWSEGKFHWNGLRATRTEIMAIDDESPAVQWLEKNLVSRKAFLEMRNWTSDVVGAQIPRAVATSQA